jgi:hypothetical protein
MGETTLGDNLGPVILLLFVGGFAGMQFQKFLWQLRRGKRGRWNPRAKVLAFQPKHDFVREKVPDAADQLRTVMKATAARDAVKKEALRRAGIGYVEVVAGDTPAELRRVVERLVQRSAAAN